MFEKEEKNFKMLMHLFVMYKHQYFNTPNGSGIGSLKLMFDDYDRCFLYLERTIEHDRVPRSIQTSTNPYPTYIQRTDSYDSSGTVLKYGTAEEMIDFLSPLVLL